MFATEVETVNVTDYFRGRSSRGGTRDSAGGASLRVHVTASPRC